MSKKIGRFLLVTGIITVFTGAGLVVSACIQIPT